MADSDLEVIERLGKRAQEAGHDGRVNLTGSDVIALATLLLELLDQIEQLKGELGELKGVKP